jgi:hypothetical protein
MKYIAIAVLFLLATLASAQSLRYDGIKHGEFQFSRLTNRHTTLHYSATCNFTIRYWLGANEEVDSKTTEGRCSVLEDVGQRFFTNKDAQFSYIILGSDLDLSEDALSARSVETYMDITNTWETQCTGKGFAEVCK